MDLYRNSGIRFGQISPQLIDFINREISLIAPDDLALLNSLSAEEYREIILHAQNRLNLLSVNQLVLKEVAPFIAAWHPDPMGYLVQSNVYLRAARPIKQQESEYIGWHRESFYGSGMEKAYNIWIPIRGVNEMNTLQFIPCTQSVPTDDMDIVSIEDPFTNRYSAGHKLGFLYSPKIIKSGIDFKTAAKLNVPEGCFACFPAELIHGSAANKSDVIRFSIDIRIIGKTDFEECESKPYHYASGKPYFVEMETT